MKPKTIKNRQKDETSNVTVGSSLDRERKVIRTIRKNTKDAFISIRCWAPSTGGDVVTHAVTITDAVKFLRGHAKYHANFEMRMVSEPNI